jgi:hypothetical protein
MRDTPMRTLAWFFGTLVFVLFFAVYSFRLGIEPALMHDDYEYTYPSFSLAERGDFGSPLLGPGLNIEKRTYNLIVYYYASVHAVLIRLFGDGASSIPLANVFHFALLAAVGAGFFVSRGALVGASVFLVALVVDERMVEAARHGRPEMTAGCCFTLAVLALWVWLGEGSRRPLVLFAAGAALTAALLSHTSVLFLALALGLVLAVPLLRQASPRAIAAFVLPGLSVPALYAYFLATDSLANIRAQMAPSQGDVLLGYRLLPLATGDWEGLAELIRGFLGYHADPAWLWLVVLAALAAASFERGTSARGTFARGARFFAALYVLFFVVHFFCFKHYVLSYRVLYQGMLYLSLALLAETANSVVARWMPRPAARHALRATAALVLLAFCGLAMVRFRERLVGQPSPFARLQGALAYALLSSGARPGDRVFVPSPFGFHLRKTFDVVAYPAPKYYRGRWSPAFRDGVRKVWGEDTLARVNKERLCDAMGLAFVLPKWALTWDEDYGIMWPFNRFLRHYPGLRGMNVAPGSSVRLPPPYRGTLRAYELSFSEQIRALDRRLHEPPTGCP